MAKNSFCLAFSSMATALSVAVLFLTGIFPLGTFALPALAGVFLIGVVAECGYRWAWAVYFAVSALSFLTAGDREAVLFFILLFGYYPILKSVMEFKFRRPARILLKLLAFNAAAVLEFKLAVWLLGVPKESFFLFGRYVPGLFLILGNAVFVVYDYALSLLAVSYWKKVHPVLQKWTRRP